MITCPNCNKQLDEGTKFCDNCGTQIVETIFCHNCGQQTSTEFAFCQNCGTSISNDATVVSNEKPKKKFALPQLPFKLSKKLIAIGSACVAVVLVASILLSVLFSGGSNNNFALYFKDGEMYYTDISKIEPWQITTRFADGDDIENYELSNYSYEIASYIQMSSDGKTLFYVDKTGEDSYGATLFYRNVNKPKQEPVKIDSDIRCYSLSESGKCVTYLKGEEGNLYQYDLTDKEKISSDVVEFVVSDDGERIIYINDEDSMYLKEAKKDKEKIDSDVSYISYASDDCDTIYYMKDGSLYKKIDGKDKEKISSDVDSVIRVYESGEAYYLKSDSEEVTLLDYIEDDMKDTDATMTEPEYPEYPSYWDFDTVEEYEAAVEQYEADYIEYQEAEEAYYDKLYRDDLREELAEETMSNSSYTLCYYNGKEEKVITDAFVYGGYTSGTNNPVLIFSIYNQSSVEKVKLSEIEYVSDIEEMVEAALYSSSEKHIAIKDSITVIDQTDASEFDISLDGKTVYFMDDVSLETNCGDVYKMSISGDKPKKPELYDSDVFASATYFIEDKYVYFKDVEDGAGDLYIDKEIVDYDVRVYNLSYIEDSEAFVYYVDCNLAKNYGTLKIFKDGKAVKISDDVRIGSVTITPNGEILYLYDYSINSYKGELFLYKNGKSEKIDDDVVAIIPIYDLKYRGDM